MTKVILSILTLITLNLGSFSQNERTSYLGVNMPPLFGTAIELGYELNLKPQLTFNVSSGYTFNSELNGSCKKENARLKISKKSGGFIKIGVRYNWRKNFNKIAPFFAVNLVNSISIEEGTQEMGAIINGEPTLWVESVFSNNYNLGVSGIIGITGNSTNRFNFDLGIQVGRVVVNNLLDCRSYMPGMGSGFLENRVQGILRLKYRIS
jgi:hypothetical protein